MDNETYKLEPKDSMMTFEFFSEGPKGTIRKRIVFQETSRPDFYNLAFGDVDMVTNELNDAVVTDNADTEKVLATVAKTVEIFLTLNTDAFVHARGSNITRTRLYRMGISHHYEAISKNFTVLGFLDDREWVIYEKNKNYSAFIIVKNK